VSAPLRATCLTAGIVLTTLLGPSANADRPSVGPSADSDGFAVAMTSQSDPTATNSDTISAGNGGVTYSYDAVCERRDGSQVTPYGCGGELACGTDGVMYAVYADRPDGTSSYVTSTCVEPGEAAPADALTPGRILEAFQRVDLPEAPLEVQPPGGVTLVNFDTILHTDAQPFTETVQLLNRQITFDIEPSEFTWTLGDGRTLTTTDPGRAWRAGLPMSEYVSHRYAEAGTVRLQLTTTWSARWRLPNGPWRPVAGTVDITSPPQDLEVTTARPQLVSYD